MFGNVDPHITGVSISKRCGGGVFAFNRGLIDKMLAECREKHTKLSITPNPSQKELK